MDFQVWDLGGAAVAELDAPAIETSESRSFWMSGLRFKLRVCLLPLLPLEPYFYFPYETSKGSAFSCKTLRLGLVFCFLGDYLSFAGKPFGLIATSIAFLVLANTGST